jgi:hypothetical protein
MPVLWYVIILEHVDRSLLNANSRSEKQYTIENGALAVIGPKPFAVQSHADKSKGTNCVDRKHYSY